jgi:hypothetical protein
MIRTVKALLDSDNNPLKVLPRAQRYQISYMLSAMWTLIFCASFGAWQWYGSLTVFHLLIITGTLMTGLTFQIANRSGIVHPNVESRAEPGTPLQDVLVGINHTTFKQQQFDAPEVPYNQVA